jgi:surface protein
MKKFKSMVVFSLALLIVGCSSNGYPIAKETKGKDGVDSSIRIEDVVTNSDNSFTFIFSDGSSLRTDPLKIGSLGVRSIDTNDDGSLTIRFSDGSSFRTDSLRGERGSKGDPGEDGKDGAKGEAGRDGVDGKNSLIKIYPLTPSNCEGFTIKVGLDQNGDGELQESEVKDSVDFFQNGTPITRGELVERIKKHRDLSRINTCKIEDMSNLFKVDDPDMEYYFIDSDISGWNTGNVKTMVSMFEGNRNFYQDISGWDVSKVEDMSKMFLNAEYFDQNLSGWDVSNVKKHDLFDQNSSLHDEHKPKFPVNSDS